MYIFNCILVIVQIVGYIYSYITADDDDDDKWTDKRTIFYRRSYLRQTLIHTHTYALINLVQHTGALSSIIFQ